MNQQIDEHPLTRKMSGILVLFGTVMLVGGTDMTKVVVALPSLTESLSLNSTEVLWVADSYPLTAGAVLVLCAASADRFGRKRIYIFGLGVAILSAGLVGFAPNPELVVAGRIGQGLGAALLIAGTVAIIRVTFPTLRLRGLAYGVWVIGFSTGSALGPLIGGVLVELGGWQWVFWINVPVLMVCLIAATMVLQESRNSDPPTLDVVSAALAGLAVALLISGLKATTQPDIPSWVTPSTLSAGLAAAVIFALRQRRLARPFLDLSLLSNRLLASSAVVIAVTIGVFNGVLYLLTQRYQVVDELSAVQAGISLLPLAASSAVGGLIGPMLYRWVTPQRIITVGLGLAAFGFLLLATLDRSDYPAGMLSLGLGAGIIMAVAANSLMSAAPAHRTADAGAIQESAFALGAGTGIAALGTIALQCSTGIAADPSPAILYGPGTETAFIAGAFLYVFFALAAGIIILGTNGKHDSGRTR